MKVGKIIHELLELKRNSMDIIGLNGYENSFDFITLENGSKITVHDFLKETDVFYKSISNRYFDLIQKLCVYYMDLVGKKYNESGIDETRKLFYGIQKYLLKHDEVTGVIYMTLASYTQSLVKE